LVQNRVVDLIFPGTILSEDHVDTEEGRVEQAQRAVRRETASQKVKNWRANGKPWSALIKPFDWGILLLLPTDLLG